MVDPAERDLWLGRVASIKQWSRRGERAPHKPLLLLYALGELRRGTTEIAWRDAAGKLGALLDDFGPPRTTQPSLPFRRLANDDGLWVVTTPSGEDPGDSAGRLAALDATGRLADDFTRALLDDPGLLVTVARVLLEDNWPPSLHDDITAAVGLDLDHVEAELVRGRVDDDRRRRRDPNFRERVLVAYEYRCAVCGFDGWMDRAAVGLEAAHIRWWSADGPDDVANGICACSLHHELLDSGVLGIDDEHRVLVSKRFVARTTAGERQVLALAGADLRLPQPGEPAPASEHIAWHADQVFRGPARLAG